MAYDGKIVFVSATNQLDWVAKMSGPTGACGWDLVCLGGVEVIPIACGHLDIFKEPYLTELAGQISGVLKAIDGCVSSEPRKACGEKARGSYCSNFARSSSGVE